MPRYSLRMLLILLANGPPLVAWWLWPSYLDYRERQRAAADHSRKLESLDEAEPGVYFLGPLDRPKRRTALEIAQEEREREIQQSIQRLKAIGVPTAKPNP